MRNLIYLFISNLLLSCAESNHEKKLENYNTSNTTITKVPTEDTTSGELQKEITLTKAYGNKKYAVQMQLPANWSAVENESHSGTVTSIFPLNAGADDKLPLGIHQDAALSYMAIWPGGLGTEFPSGDARSFNKARHIPSLSFAVDREVSKIFLLKDGTPWAYFIAPQNVPSSWNEAGFIFAQIQTNNFQAHCYDKNTGKEKAMQQCDPLMGDKLVREGNRNEKHAAIIHKMLSSIELNKSPGATATEMIEVEQPVPNATVRSPLTVAGKARGNWYFEGTFSVKLYDASNTLLASAPAKAKGKWMTEDYVPFTTTLSFKVPIDESGRLVFQKANPSGLKENAQSYSMPVIFPTADQ